MTRLAPYTRKSLATVLPILEAHAFAVVAELRTTAWHTSEPVPYAERRSGRELHLKVGDSWGKLFDCAWFRFEGAVPASADGLPVALLLDVNGELCVVDRDGNPVRGLTNASSVFDVTLGRPGKTVFPLAERARGGERIEVWADAGCNDLFGNLSGNGTVRQASLAVPDQEIRSLAWDFEVLLDLLDVLPEDSPRARRLLATLGEAAWAVVPSPDTESARRAREILAPLLGERGGTPALRVSAIGHAHIDLAWLWPIRESVRKAARTFATALANMERFDEYIFGESQPQLYQWVKDGYPALYERIRQRVRDGKLEPQGAMWVEADTNLIGAESMVRQILLGRRFFRSEFGVDPRYLWLPDVFGYSGALPQVLAKAGISCFVTQKLSWNLVNVFPHHSFRWQGIDGSSVLAHMLPEATYNGPALPRSLHRIQGAYAQGDVSGHALMLFGIGDGGGGPGEEHLERLRRVRDLAGLPPVKQEPASAFLDRWARDAERFPVWVGELYLERHQGTFTTGARLKAGNRRMELALRELEWLASMDRILNGASYPAARLDTIWKEVLLYQFHDILPGDSIKRVHDETEVRYEVLGDEVKKLAAAHRDSLARRVAAGRCDGGVVLFNPLSWTRLQWVHLHGQWVHAKVPALGWAILDSSPPREPPSGLAAAAGRLESDLLRVTFHADGSIASVYDKGADREIVAEGERANRLSVYHDPGDAWDFPLDYERQDPRTMTLVSSTPRREGPRAIMEQVYELGHSRLTQEVVLTAGSPRIDFVTRARWRETATMLRTRFPVDIHAEDASFEIQFGHVRRPTHSNTTWDLAKAEVPAHRWADLSQRDYGVALLNDCKYGYKVKGNVIDLDLLRSVPYPGPRLVRDDEVEPGSPHHGYTDQGEHAFCYSLFPHRGDAVAGGVVRAGYELNVPLSVATLAGGSSGAPSAADGSFLEVSEAAVIVEAMKKAEDSDETIIRLYEATHAAVRATIRFSFPVLAAAEVDLMEENPRPLEVRENCVSLAFRPFEIKTVRVKTS